MNNTQLLPIIDLSVEKTHSYPEPLVLGNGKLGPTVWHFSVPAVFTCYGRSTLCESACYACKGHYHHTNVQKRHRLNHAMREESSFELRVVSQIERMKAELVRVHPAGDFDSTAYIQSWGNIARECPDTLFWAYTRSWRVPEFLPELVLLSRLPNFQMWWSCDRETGAPPRFKGIKRAYMATDDLDLPRMRVDLVFRTERELKLAVFDSTLVCPTERKRARPGQKHITCDKCRICFDPDRLAWLDQFNKTVRSKLV